MRILLKTALAIVAAGLLWLAGFVAYYWAPDRSVAELSARWAQPPSVFVAIDGMQVHVRDEGPRDDPLPIVLLHGTSASLHTWDGWVEGLKTTRRVVRLDLPGFGLTGPFPNNDYRTTQYAAFMAAFLSAMRIDRCVLVGNSFGGQIALETTLAMPSRVSKLVLIDSSGYPLAPTSIPLAFQMARLPIIRDVSRVVLPRGIVEDSVRNVYGDPARVSAALVDRYYDLTLREGNRQALGLRLQHVAVDSIAARIPAIKVPTLILWGGRDRLIPPDAAKRFQQDIVGSQLVILDDLGHVPHEENPQQTLAAARKFLDALQ
jgi:pimeloyl-ACP methyl ester carboxylesterase